MAHDLNLYAFIVGPGILSPVTIESSKTVGHLKQSILENNKNYLEGVDANLLTLYHVELNVPVELQADPKMVGQLVAQAVNGEHPLWPLRPLSDIFPVDPKETINIVVGNISE
jgi:Crinkler effector protein N-terminal domain